MRCYSVKNVARECRQESTVGLTLKNHFWADRHPLILIIMVQIMNHKGTKAEKENHKDTKAQRQKERTTKTRRHKDTKTRKTDLLIKRIQPQNAPATPSISICPVAEHLTDFRDFDFLAIRVTAPPDLDHALAQRPAPNDHQIRQSEQLRILEFDTGSDTPLIVKHLPPVLLQRGGHVLCRPVHVPVFRSEVQ